MNIEQEMRSGLMQKRRGTGAWRGILYQCKQNSYSSHDSVFHRGGRRYDEEGATALNVGGDRSEVEKNASLESGGGNDKSISDKRQRRGDKRFWSIPCRSDCYG